jgi:hypothetical protein
MRTIHQQELREMITIQELRLHQKKGSSDEFISGVLLRMARTIDAVLIETAESFPSGTTAIITLSGHYTRGQIETVVDIYLKNGFAVAIEQDPYSIWWKLIFGWEL